MITIVTDEKKTNIGEKLQLFLQKNGREVTLLPIADSSIKPCYGCGGCETKTFGRCVIRDDMDLILPVLAKSNIWIYITQIVWGSPSYETKKVLDKSALLGSRFYKIRHGELVKGVGVNAEKIAVIGMTENQGLEENQDFVFWAKEMGNIMDLKCLTAVWEATQDEHSIQQFAKEIISR